MWHGVKEKISNKTKISFINEIINGARDAVVLTNETDVYNSATKEGGGGGGEKEKHQRV